MTGLATWWQDLQEPVRQGLAILGVLSAGALAALALWLLVQALRHAVRRIGAAFHRAVERIERRRKRRDALRAELDKVDPADTSSLWRRIDLRRSLLHPMRDRVMRGERADGYLSQSYFDALLDAQHSDPSDHATRSAALERARSELDRRRAQLERRRRKLGHELGELDHMRQLHALVRLWHASLRIAEARESGAPDAAKVAQALADAERAAEDQPKIGYFWQELARLRADAWRIDKALSDLDGVKDAYVVAFLVATDEDNRAQIFSDACSMFGDLVAEESAGAPPRSGTRGRMRRAQLLAFGQWLWSDFLHRSGVPTLIDKRRKSTMEDDMVFADDLSRQDKIREMEFAANLDFSVGRLGWNLHGLHEEETAEAGAEADPPAPEAAGRETLRTAAEHFDRSAELYQEAARARGPADEGAEMARSSADAVRSWSDLMHRSMSPERMEASRPDRGDGGGTRIVHRPAGAGEAEELGWRDLLRLVVEGRDDDHAARLLIALEDAEAGRYETLKFARFAIVAEEALLEEPGVFKPLDGAAAPAGRAALERFCALIDAEPGPGAEALVAALTKAYGIEAFGLRLGLPGREIARESRRVRVRIDDRLVTEPVVPTARAVLHFGLRETVDRTRFTPLMPGPDLPLGGGPTVWVERRDKAADPDAADPVLPAAYALLCALGAAYEAHMGALVERDTARAAHLPGAAGLAFCRMILSEGCTLTPTPALAAIAAEVDADRLDLGAAQILAHRLGLSPPRAVSGGPTVWMDQGIGDRLAACLPAGSSRSVSLPDRYGTARHAFVPAGGGLYLRVPGEIRDDLLAWAGRRLPTTGRARLVTTNERLRPWLRSILAPRWPGVAVVTSETLRKAQTPVAAVSDGAGMAAGALPPEGHA